MSFPPCAEPEPQSIREKRIPEEEKNGQLSDHQKDISPQRAAL